MARWSMGFFGDLVWDLLPEVRPRIQELLADRIDTAVVLERELERPELPDFNGPLITGVIEPIEEGRLSPARS